MTEINVQNKLPKSCPTARPTGYALVIFLAMACMPWCMHSQFQTRFDPAVSSTYLNPAYVVPEDNTTLCFSRHVTKMNSVQERTSYLAGWNLHLPMQKQPNAYASILFHYTNEYLNFSKGIRRQEITGGYAHHMQLHKNSQVSAAIRMSYHSHHFSMDGYSTGSQYEVNEGFNPNLHTNEPFAYYHSSWLSVGAGIHYLHRLSDGQRIGAGIAGFDLNKPLSSSGENNNRKHQVFFLHVSYWMPLWKNRLSVQPRVDFSNQYGISCRAGTQFLLHFPDDLNGFRGISIQAMQHIHQSNRVGLNLHHPKIRVGMNYTFFNKGIPLQNATEMVLAFTFGKPENRKSTPQIADEPATRTFYAFEKEESTNEPMVVEKKSKVSFQLSRYVDFEFNSFALSEEAKIYLNELVRLLLSDEELRIEIIGHTDNVGSTEANRKLSLQRAKAVADYLADNEISIRRINITGFGETKPLNDNASGEDQAHNRRVDIHIYK